MAHLHPVYDTDPHFLVDSTSRIISYSSKEKLLLVQGDHNCQRYTFEMPRYIDGHDMKLCDRVEVHYTNIDSRNERGKSYGLYKVTDMQISTKDENVLVFSWLISRLATVYAGVTNFTIRFACTTNGEIDYVWSTGVYTSVVIASTIDNEENVIGQYYENLIPENIREGVEIGGVEGTLKADFIYQDKDITLTNEGTVEVTADEGKLLSKVTVSTGGALKNTADATATEASILSGETAYINGKKATGTIPTYDGDTEVLFGESWVMNESLTLVAVDDPSIVFTSSGKTFTGFKMDLGSDSQLRVMYGDTAVYEASIDWASDGYRELYFHRPPTGDLLTCLQQNAVKVSSGTEPIKLTSPNGILLKVDKKYCYEDVAIAPALQEKTVTPSSDKQYILSDNDYAGLSKVTVKAVPLQEKTAVKNGTITPDSGYLGLSKVIVNTAGAEPVATASEMDALLTVANIGHCYRFIGATDNTYANGDIYEVVSDNNDSATFKFKHYSVALPSAEELEV